MPASADLDRVAMVVLRFMRRPVFTLILVYAIGITGMALIPGRSVDGETEYMSLFHAFYFFTYTATTTGFGEIPTTFSDEQRLWAIFCLYIGVIAWLYAIGSMIRLLQNPHFLFALNSYRFARTVKRISEPFFILCGFGDTGSLLARGLNEHGFRAVILDSDPERIKALGLRDYKDSMPGLCADASIPKHLVDAGIRHPHCKAIVILHSDEDVNFKIAVMTRYLNASLPVICRSTSPRHQEHLESMGNVTVINSFEIFAQLISMAITAPLLRNFNSWLVRAKDVKLGESSQVPRGTWILCGYGRLGRWLHDYLKKHDIQVVIIDPEIEQDQSSSLCICDYADHETLKRAGIENAAGVVAGTDDDTYNLSVLMCARSLNPSVFTIVRQNDHTNQLAFDAVDADLILQSSLTTARRILKHLISPLVQKVIELLKEESDEVLENVVHRLQRHIGEQVPQLWRVRLDTNEAPAVGDTLRMVGSIQLSDLLRDPSDRSLFLDCAVLAIERQGRILTVPTDSEAVRSEDELLLCGTRRSRNLLEATLAGPYTLHYLTTGEELPRSYLFQWLARKA